METDLAMLGKLNAEDFLNSNPDGSLVDRAGFIAQIARPSSISGFRAEDVRIRLLGEFATPATGGYTDIWARRGLVARFS